MIMIMVVRSTDRIPHGYDYDQGFSFYRKATLEYPII